MHEQTCCVYVDAAYLLAAATRRITGTSLRGSVTVDYEAVVSAVHAHVTSSGMQLVRVNWYDTADDAVADADHRSVATLPRVKLHLGRIGFDGSQRGVAIKMGLDLVLRVPHHVRTIYLVSGDTALVEFVEEAQAQGLQVILLAVPTRDGQPDSTSHDLRATADELELLDSQLLDTAVTARGQEPAPEVGNKPIPSPAVVAQRAQHRPLLARDDSDNSHLAPPTTETVLVCTSSPDTTTVGGRRDEFSDDELDEVMEGIVKRVLNAWPYQLPAHPVWANGHHHRVIPKEIDSALLNDLSNALEILDLPDALRHQLRARFWDEVEKRA